MTIFINSPKLSSVFVVVSKRETFKQMEAEDEGKRGRKRREENGRALSTD